MWYYVLNNFAMKLLSPSPHTQNHYDDVIKSPAPPLLTQPFIRVQIKENIKAPRHWPLCGEFTGERPAEIFLWAMVCLVEHCKKYMQIMRDWLIDLLYFVIADKYRTENQTIKHKKANPTGIKSDCIDIKDTNKTRYKKINTQHDTNRIFSHHEG